MTATTYCIKSQVGERHRFRFVVAPTAEEALDLAMREDKVHYAIRAAGEDKSKERQMIAALGAKGEAEVVDS